MDNMKMEEKIKRIVLEEIKNSAIEAWSKPTDDNICKMFNNVDYLRKVLKNDNDSAAASSISKDGIITDITRMV